MATSPVAMTPPPGSDDQQGGVPTTPAAASPAPAGPSPMMQQTTQSIISVANILRGIAKSVPEAAPHVAEANEALQKIMATVMKASQPGEPQAGPFGG